MVKFLSIHPVRPKNFYINLGKTFISSWETLIYSVSIQKVSLNLSNYSNTRTVVYWIYWLFGRTAGITIWDFLEISEVGNLDENFKLTDKK